MKRIGNLLYDKVCDLDNLYLAYSKARQGKGKSYGVLHFEKNLTKNIIQIQNDLITETYRTSKYDVFTIHDPKERIIYRLPFRDRVVHHAIMNVLESIWTSVFVSHSYSCIKGKGIHGALRHIKKGLKDKEGKLFTNAAPIKDALDKVPEDGFPFLATIKQRRYDSGNTGTFYFT